MLKPNADELYSSGRIGGYNNEEIESRVKSIFIPSNECQSSLKASITMPVPTVRISGKWTPVWICLVILMKPLFPLFENSIV